MPESPAPDITELLAEWHGGDEQALERLLPGISLAGLKRSAAMD
jgi:hypothetical protein